MATNKPAPLPTHKGSVFDTRLSVVPKETKPNQKKIAGKNPVSKEG